MSANVPGIPDAPELTGEDQTLDSSYLRLGPADSVSEGDVGGIPQILSQPPLAGKPCYLMLLPLRVFTFTLLHCFFHN